MNLKTGQLYSDLDSVPEEEKSNTIMVTAEEYAILKALNDKEDKIRHLALMRGENVDKYASKESPHFTPIPQKSKHFNAFPGDDTISNRKNRRLGEKRFKQELAKKNRADKKKLDKKYKMEQKG